MSRISAGREAPPYGFVRYRTYYPCSNQLFIIHQRSDFIIHHSSFVIHYFRLSIRFLPQQFHRVTPRKNGQSRTPVPTGLCLINAIVLRQTNYSSAQRLHHSSFIIHYLSFFCSALWLCLVNAISLPYLHK